MQAASRRTGAVALRAWRQGLSPLTGASAPGHPPFPSSPLAHGTGTEWVTPGPPCAPPHHATPSPASFWGPLSALSPFVSLAPTSQPLLGLSGAATGTGTGTGAVTALGNGLGPGAGAGIGKGAGMGVGMPTGLLPAAIFSTEAGAAVGSSGAEASPKKKRGTAKKDKDKPKRPLPSYMRFFVETRPKVIVEHPEAKAMEVGKIISERWKKLTASEKQPYADAYAKEMAAFKEKEKKRLASAGSE